MPEMEELTQLINSWAAGDSDDGNKLFSRITDDLRRSAHRNLRGDAAIRWQTTELVNEAFVKLSAQRTQWRSREHFFAVLEIITKRCVLEELRRARRQRRDYRREVAIDDAMSVTGPSFCEMASELDDALAELRRRDPIQAEIFERRVLRGETFAEIAEATGLSLAKVRREFLIARAWLAVRVSDGRAAAEAGATIG
jgi:RNA polymerase sigma factor (TIGR02999 family)